ncbi:MAG: hypothetical protein LBB50_03455 [Oscillospiraceae bacterium]|nr:hypothetical protein [Oscillospiraceae bacterium]
MAKKNRSEEIATEELQRQQAEAERLRQEEADKARKREELRAMARQQEQSEKTIMDLLVENDEAPRTLETLAVQGREVNLWSLRYMITERLGLQILLGGDYTQAELQEWLIPYALHDEKSYVRRAAIKHLTDIAALAHASSKDAEPVVRKKAVEQLFKFLEQKEALEALNVVALGDSEPDLRHMAVLRIVDQTVIAKVAKTDAEPVIRQSATKKLTSQADLAWVAIHDATVQVRATAAELMTDVRALVKAAVADKAPEPAVEEPLPPEKATDGEDVA